MSDLFETASRLKIRFETKRGVLTAEDLWDLSMNEIDTLFKSLRKQQRNTLEESLLETLSQEDQILGIKIDLVRHVFETKKIEREAAFARAAQKEEKQRLLEILARKQQAGLEALSEEEILTRIAALE